MKVIIRLKDKELGDKIFRSFEPLSKINGNEIHNVPVVGKPGQDVITMLFGIGFPYTIDNYVYIDNCGAVDVFELMDPVYANDNPESPDKLSGMCLWKRYNWKFCRNSDELLTALVEYLLTER